MRPRLAALTDVGPGVKGWEATGPEPWLRCDLSPAPGSWLRIEYSSGLTDPLTRPVLRFVGRDSLHDELLPAAMLGRAIWIGQAPRDVREVHISPALGPGLFAFRIERWDTLPVACALRHFGARNLGRAFRHGWGRLRGLESFARAQARRALGATPLERYGEWRRLRGRAFDPSFDLSPATPVRFHILAPDAPALGPMLAAQTWPHWTLGGVPDDEDFVLTLGPGDRLEPHALATLARAAAPDIDAVYADEDACDPGGERRHAPRLKPDWSPLFAKSGYAGAPLVLRGAAWRAGGWESVAHVRRVLVSRRDPAPLALPPTPAPITQRRKASLIVPTRDRPDLLRACVASLDRHDPGADFELVVIDNGSTQGEALACLAALAKRADTRVLRRPGPFNFSALANAGAREARLPFLLFLNDDIEALGADWLGLMLEHAALPRIGAVGAKLLYPDGRLQHGGLTLGLDGLAGHIQRRAQDDDPGYLGQLAWPREVSAVTGACLAVEASKFFAVGGFDEARLPVELNDVDLCLRLAERGEVCVMEPRARLLHRESATRGANRWLDSRYSREHKYFRERWARQFRDDPYFHPALSLDALDTALG